MKITTFLPCRRGSERVIQKNIKPFAGYSHGLIEIKLRQLQQLEMIDCIILSTNDEYIIDFVRSLASDKIVLHRRDESLASSQTSTDELVAHALSLIPDSHILWTHVTSPFINTSDYDQIIKRYLQALEEGYDSLMTTSLIQNFLWDGEKPLNYDRSIEKWPRTQTIQRVHEVNSGIFLASSEIYRTLDDRIGKKPYLYPLDKIKSLDIDWPEDFMLAECIVEKKLAKL